MSPAGSRSRTGVFGGTFNPVHVAHLRAAEEVAEALELTRVLFVPAADPPHKRAGAHDPIAPAALRLAWLEEAIEGNPRFAVDPLEIERGGTSYSVDTLREIGERIAPERPVFIIGWDAFIEIDTWKDPATLFALADFAVLTRPPVSDATLASFVPSCLAETAQVSEDGRETALPGGGRIEIVPITALDVSASAIRARLREGRSVRYLLPERVRQAVESSGAYHPPRDEER